MERSPEARFHEIYEACADAVTAYVRRRAAADAVEDIVAETFLVCWRKVEQVPSEPLPWLYAVARKTLANHRRAAVRNADATRADAIADGPPVSGDSVLAKAFPRLSDGDREVLRLIAWEELSFREAAAVLDCSVIACRVRFHRAKQRLARHLETLEAASTAAPPQRRPEGATR